MKKLTVVLISMMLAGPAVADEVFTATLTGAAAGTTSPATGTATLILNDAGTQIQYTITYSGLSSAETASHIHRPTGIAFTLPVGTPKVGTWDFPPAEDIALLRDGQLYVNVHTVKHLGGEIRGNLSLETTPVETSTWGRVKSLYRK